MSPLLITLGGTAAAAAMTWFFCMRPMLRKDGTADASCCAAPARSIDDEIRAAREDLHRLQQANSIPPGLVTASGARVHEN
jgi:hypothetical protein